MGGMSISANGTNVKYVWDYVADKAVPESEMMPGTERWAASERKKWAVVKRQLGGEPEGF